MAPNFAERIATVDPERLHFAIGVYCAAAAMRGPYDSPREFKLNLVEDDGSRTTISFNDIPQTRGLLAVKKEFPGEEFERMSFRLLNLSKAIKSPKLKKWGLVRHSKNGQIEIHDAVVNALAMAPFRKSGRLDNAAFLHLVQSEQKRLEESHTGA